MDTTVSANVTNEGVTMGSTEGANHGNEASTEGANHGNEAVEIEEGGEQFVSEFVPGASQPTHEDIDDSQGGVFNAPTPPTNSGPGSSGVPLKAWQKKKQTITTRAEILRARSSRQRKVNKKYVD